MRHRGTGGTERYLNLVAAHLARAGHAVTIVCRSHEGSPHEGVRFVKLKRTAVGGAWRMWAFAKDVEEYVRTTDYDVVFGLGKTWAHDVIRLGGGCHGTYVELAHKDTLKPWERFTGRRFKNRIALRIERKALAPGDDGAYPSVITNSELVKRDVLERYAVPEELVTVIYNGVDTERFHTDRGADRARIRKEAGLEPDDAVVLFLGTGYGRKGLGRVLAALPALQGRSDVRLLVVGYDGQRKRWESEARRLGIADRTRFLGGRRDAEACFAAGDVYVLPTRYDPFANSTLEALASGLPVITTNTNGGSEILASGEHGTVLADGDDARAARPACRALAERFDAAHMMERSVEVLEAVCAAKTERSAER
jgi:UDP-glucose:(heptosyl)LPS alpha-1,3-glucosyltransferase